MVIKNEGKKSKKLLTLYPTICFPKFLEMCLTPKIPLPKSKLESGQKIHFLWALQVLRVSNFTFENAFFDKIKY